MPLRCRISPLGDRRAAVSHRWRRSGVSHEGHQRIGIVQDIDAN